jgi:hypothetical protein
MAWVRLDENFATHPKVLEAGPLGMAMQVAALCYCNRHQTDGRITLAATRTLIDLDGFSNVYHEGDEITTERIVKDLVNAGLWHESGHDCPICPPIERGLVIHGYLELQPSKADIEAKKAQVTEAGRRGGLAKAKRTAKRMPSETLSESPSEPLAKVWPDPDTDTQKTNTPPAKAVGDLPEFIEFWSVYPRRTAKPAAVKAWAKAIKRADTSEIIAGARRYRDDPRRTAEFTAHPATWLNNDRWADEAPVATEQKPDWEE